MNNQRHKFDIPHNIVYLNQAYMSPQLMHISDLGKVAVERKNHPWKIGPEDFFTDSEAVREAFAEIVHSSPDDIAILPSASYGIGIAARNTKLKSGDEIILLDEQFPSNVYPWIERAKQKKADVTFIKKEEGKSWTECVLDGITKKTKVVSIPNVHWTDGSVLDLRKIGDKCEQFGCMFVIDATQSLGAIPMTASMIKADFIIAAAYKWLLGPYSVAYMYVSEKYHDGRPIEFNWINKKDSEEFSGLVNYKEDFQTGARRFDVGEKSNFVLLPMALGSLKQVNTWTVPEIASYTMPILKKIAKAASENGYDPTPESERAPHIMGIRMPNKQALALSEEFKKNNIFVSVRGNSIRVSPYVYTTKKDLEAFLDILSKK